MPPTTHLAHFGLQRDPFALSPKLDFVYRSRPFAAGLQHLQAGTDGDDAVVVASGAVGTGKTMALNAFLDGLGRRYVFALITNTQVGTVELLKLVLEDLGAAVAPGQTRDELEEQFRQIAAAARRGGSSLLLVIDEAQNLAPAVLEDLRRLVAGAGDEGPAARLVLVGQPELETVLAHPDLERLRRSAGRHFRFHPLDARETAAYLDHRMAVAGCPQPVFGPKAVAAIHDRSGGVPRVINTLAGEALLSAYVAGRKAVTAADVGAGEEAPASEPRRETPPPTPIPRREVRAEAPAPQTPPARPEPPRTERSAKTGRVEPTDARRRQSQARRKGSPLRALAPVLVLVLIVAAAAWRWSDIRALWPSGEPDASPETTAMAEPVTDPVTDRVADPVADRVVDQATAAPTIVDPADDPEGAPDADSPAPVDEEPAVETVARDAGPEAETAGAAPEAEIRTPVPAGADRYFIHVSSFQEPARAAAAIARYTARGWTAVARTVTVDGSLWYRVQLGPFAVRDEAVVRANGLRDAGDISYYRIVREAPLES